MLRTLVARVVRLTNLPTNRHRSTTALPALLVGALTATFACTVAPIHLGKPVLEKPPLIKDGSRLALFTVLMRSVGVARSQGTPWIARAEVEEYRHWRGELDTILKDGLGFQLIDNKAVQSQSLVQGGLFPFYEEFHLNPDRLPIARGAKEVEYMLRTAGSLKADYLALVLFDYEVSKVMTRPASVTARLHFELYSPAVGLVYSGEIEATETALPYDRSQSMGELEKSYQVQIKQALMKSMQRVLTETQKKLKNDLKSPPQVVQ